MTSLATLTSLLLLSQQCTQAEEARPDPFGLHHVTKPKPFRDYVTASSTTTSNVPLGGSFLEGGTSAPAPAIADSETDCASDKVWFKVKISLHRYSHTLFTERYSENII